MKPCPYMKISCDHIPALESELSEMTAKRDELVAGVARLIKELAAARETLERIVNISPEPIPNTLLIEDIMADIALQGIHKIKEIQTVSDIRYRTMVANYKEIAKLKAELFTLKKKGGDHG